MQIVVLGMHRSGTSAMTGLLVKMGAYFGPAKLAMPSNFDNPRGFWERLDVVKLNDDLLAASGADWQTPHLFDSAKIPAAVLARGQKEIRKIVADLSSRPVAVVKDPRMCITADHWLPAFPHPVCLLVLRNPLAVARSLLSRNRLSLPTGLALWEFHIRAAVRALRGRPCITLDYDAMMTRPAEHLMRLFNSLQQAGGSDFLKQPGETEITATLDTRLRHHDISRDDLAAHATTGQLALADALAHGDVEAIADQPVSRASLEAMDWFMAEEYRLRKSAARLAEISARAGSILNGLADRVEVRSAVLASLMLRRRGTTPAAMRRTAEQLGAASAECLGILGMQPAAKTSRTARVLKRVLLTEIGSNSTGDELLYGAAARRFSEAGWRVSLLCRTRPRCPQTTALAWKVDELVVEDFFDAATSPESLAALFARRHPQAYERTAALVGQHDLVAICPGGRFTTGYNNPRALLTASVALELGVPLVNLHQSFGPMDRQKERKLLTAVLSQSRVTLVRDECSRAFLSELGVPKNIIVPTRDAAFAEPCGNAGEIRYDLGLNIRHGFNGHISTDVLRDFLRQLHAKRPQTTVLVYSTTHTLDGKVLAAVDGLATAEPAVPMPEAALAAPSSCRVNISDSFHGVIFSMMARRPVIPCQTDFSSWKIQGTRMPGMPDFNVWSGLNHGANLPGLLEETLRALDDPSAATANDEARLTYCREAAESGWRELFQRLATPKIGGA